MRNYNEEIKELEKELERVCQEKGKENTIKRKKNRKDSHKNKSKKPPPVVNTDDRTIRIGDRVKVTTEGRF